MAYQSNIEKRLSLLEIASDNDDHNLPILWAEPGEDAAQIEQNYREEHGIPANKQVLVVKWVSAKYRGEVDM